MRTVPTITVRRGRSWWVATLIILLALATIGLLGQADNDPSPLDSLPAGLDSTTAVKLQDQLPQGDATVAVVLHTADEGKLWTAALDGLRRLHPAGEGGPGLVVSDDGTAALVSEIRAAADADGPDGVTAQVTGPAAIQADLAAVFDGANLRLLLATAGVVGILLLITYRSPIL